MSKANCPPLSHLNSISYPLMCPAIPILYAQFSAELSLILIVDKNLHLYHLPWWVGSGWSVTLSDFQVSHWALGDHGMLHIFWKIRQRTFHVTKKVPIQLFPNLYEFIGTKLFHKLPYQYLYQPFSKPNPTNSENSEWTEMLRRLDLELGKNSEECSDQKKEIELYSLDFG